MTYTRCPVLALVIAALFTSTLANDKKDDDAKALVQRAMNASAIREEGSAPFRLKANVKVIHDDGSILEGTYTETWVSNTRWRKEIVLGEFRRTQVVAGRKMWNSATSNVLPEHLADISATFDPWFLLSGSWKADKFEDRQVDGKAAHCFRAKRSRSGVSELCFESATGVLTATIVPVQLGDRNVEGLCLYRGYQPLGDRVVPTSYSYFEDKKPRLQAQILELKLHPPLDDSLFAPLPDAKELVHCPTRAQPPVPVHNVAPDLTRNSGVVRISLVVGVDGRPHDLQVASSLDPASDNSALEAVRQWKFKPAICEGEPIEVQIAIDIDFRPLP